MYDIRDIRILILVDNQTVGGLEVEHGFAAWIETPDLRILFDTGQSDIVARNADRLHCDLGKADVCVLSHGHYDHTGGLPAVLNLNRRLQLYAHPDCLLERYSIHEGAGPKPVSMPAAARAALEHLPENQINWVLGWERIGPGLFLTGPIPREHPMEDTGGPFFLDREGTQKDWIRDDLALCIQTNKGLIVVTGCCHSGVLNTLAFVTSRFRDTPIVDTLLGGLHLNSAPEARMKATIADLRARSIRQIVACHCTGIDAARQLREALGPAVTTGRSGLTYPSIPGT
ncbi:MAG: MBL fold metallo-hydrolase [Verrucomicrobiota bacterium]|nr:MBL fold metallo-hydrolase [Verrucomicrobiota bacterium]